MNNVIKSDFVDELKVEGIKYKGYGILPKYVMIDPDLTIEAKGIYAYFCSFAGSGNTAFPSRDKIVSDLQINKDTYGKHFKIITSQGYIEVKQDNQGGKGKGFSKNIYTLISNPKKFTEKPEDKKHNQAYVRIRFGGLEAAGFGFIPKAVMLDSRLSLKAKAIYAYFCSFAGSGNSAFPKHNTILYHLGITPPAYYKHFNLLIECNYITTVQRHINGRLSINDYYLNENPDNSEKMKKKILAVSSQIANFSDTQNAQIANFSDTQNAQIANFSDTQKQDTQKQDTQKPDTNNNNIYNNNVYNYQSINQQAAQPPCPAQPEWIDGRNEFLFYKEIQDELYKAGTLPQNFLFDERKLTVAIRLMTAWREQKDWYKKQEEEHNILSNDATLRYKAFLLFVEALIEMLSPMQSPITLKGSFITYGKVYERLQPYIKISDYFSTLYIEDIDNEAISGFIKGCENSIIRNHLQYMKACIWTAMQTGNIATLAQFKYDLLAQFKYDF